MTSAPQDVFSPSTFKTSSAKARSKTCSCSSFSMDNDTERRVQAFLWKKKPDLKFKAVHKRNIQLIREVYFKYISETIPKWFICTPDYIPLYEVNECLLNESVFAPMVNPDFSQEMKQKVKFLCEYEKQRLITSKKEGSCLGDPLLLFCEEVKEWIVNISWNGNSLLVDLQCRVKYYSALKESSDFASEFIAMIAKLLISTKTLLETFGKIDASSSSISNSLNEKRTDSNRSLVIKDTNATGFVEAINALVEVEGQARKEIGGDEKSKREILGRNMKGALYITKSRLRNFSSLNRKQGDPSSAPDSTGGSPLPTVLPPVTIATMDTISSDTTSTQPAHLSVTITEEASSQSTIVQPVVNIESTRSTSPELPARPPSPELPVGHPSPEPDVKDTSPENTPVISLTPSPKEATPLPTPREEETSGEVPEEPEEADPLPSAPTLHGLTPLSNLPALWTPTSGEQESEGALSGEDSAAGDPPTIDSRSAITLESTSSHKMVGDGDAKRENSELTEALSSAAGSEMTEEVRSPLSLEVTKAKKVILLTGYTPDPTTVKHHEWQAAKEALEKTQMHLKAYARFLNAEVVYDWSSKVTHVASCASTRTLVMMIAYLEGKWIMNDGWITQSLLHGSWLPEGDYGVKLREQPPLFEKKYFLSESFLMERSASLQQTRTLMEAALCQEVNNRDSCDICLASEKEEVPNRSMLKYKVLTWDQMLDSIFAKPSSYGFKSADFSLIPKDPDLELQMKAQLIGMYQHLNRRRRHPNNVTEQECEAFTKDVIISLCALAKVIVQIEEEGDEAGNATESLSPIHVPTSIQFTDHDSESASLKVSRQCFEATKIVLNAVQNIAVSGNVKNVLDPSNNIQVLTVPSVEIDDLAMSVAYLKLCLQNICDNDGINKGLVSCQKSSRRAIMAEQGNSVKAMCGFSIYLLSGFYITSEEGNYLLNSLAFLESEVLKGVSRNTLITSSIQSFYHSDDDDETDPCVVEENKLLLKIMYLFYKTVKDLLDCMIGSTPFKQSYSDQVHDALRLSEEYTSGFSKFMETTFSLNITASNNLFHKFLAKEIGPHYSEFCPSVIFKNPPFPLPITSESLKQDKGTGFFSKAMSKLSGGENQNKLPSVNPSLSEKFARKVSPLKHRTLYIYARCQTVYEGIAITGKLYVCNGEIVFRAKNLTFILPIFSIVCTRFQSKLDIAIKDAVEVKLPVTVPCLQIYTRQRRCFQFFGFSSPSGNDTENGDSVTTLEVGRAIDLLWRQSCTVPDPQIFASRK